MLQRIRALSFAAVLAMSSMGQALWAQGTVSAWGHVRVLGEGTNYYGNSNKPGQISGLSGVIAVAQGPGFVMALKSDGTVWTWGSVQYGELGVPGVLYSDVPLQVSGLTGVTAIAAGTERCLAVKSDGTVWGWGRNDSGQLGNISQYPYVPQQIPGLTGVTAVAVGYDHNLALKSDGTVSAWARNSSGQLGLGDTVYRFTPTTIPSLTGVTAIAAGHHMSMALKSDGTLLAWGRNNYGQLGNGSLVNSSTPVPVTGLPGPVKSVALGEDGASFAVMLDGTVRSWGMEWQGRLGHGSTSGPTPLPVPGITGVTAIFSSTGFTLAVKSDGTVWGWGQNYARVLGDPPVSPALTPVQIKGISTATGFGASHSYDGLAGVVITSQGLATSVLAESGTPQSTAASTPFGQPLSVRVRDANNLPVEGGRFILRAPAPPGASAVFTNEPRFFHIRVFTDAQGIATVPVEANSVAGGPYTVTATVLGLPDAIFTLTNTPAVPVSISVTPANPSIAKGRTRQFTATGTYANSSTQDITSQVTWASAASAIATITAGGLATGADIGTSAITATLLGVSGSTLLTVTAPVLQSIAVTPTNPSIVQGLTQQFTATGTYSDASTQDISGAVTWSSGTPATATVNSTGLATAVQVGTSAIGATQGSISGASVLTVVAPSPATITLTNLSQTYTGSPLTPTATTTPPGLPLTWTGAPQTEAGSYTVTATSTAAKYTGSASGVFTINKASSTVTISGGGSFTFDGQPHGASAFVTGAGGLNQPVTVTYSGTCSAPPVTVAQGTNCTATANYPGGVNHLPNSASTVITITKATPVLTWSVPAAIQFGSALGSGQLNATANVPGTFVYTPPAGTVLAVGTHPLSVAFTPSDAVNYTASSANTSITVNTAGGSGGTPANLVVTRTLRRTGDTISVDLVLANTGGTAAQNIVLTAVRVGTTSAAGLPLSVGTIEAGQSQALTLQIPGTAGNPGAASSLTVSGIFTGGSFQSTLRITLP